MPASLLAETADSGGRKIVVRTFPDRDLTFIQLLVQRLTRQSAGVIALLGVTSDQPALVFAQSSGQLFDMGALMKKRCSLAFRWARWREQGHGAGRTGASRGDGSGSFRARVAAARLISSALAR